MNGGKTFLRVTPTEEGLLRQYERLRKENPKCLVGDETERWLHTHNLSKVGSAAGYAAETYKFLCETYPSNQTLKLERARAEFALRAEAVKWAPKFAQLWEGKAHFTLYTDTGLTNATYIGLATHEDDGGERIRNVIFSDNQKAIDAEALALLASTGEKGKELSEQIQERLKQRDEILDRYFESIGIENDERHTGPEFQEDTNRIIAFLIAAEPTQKLLTIGANGETVEMDVTEEKAEFLATTDIQEDEFKTFLFDLWQAELEEVWSDDIDIQVPRWAKWLMVSLWFDVVGPLLEKAYRKPASLARPVFVDAIAFHSRGNNFNRESSTLTFEGRRLASILDASIDLDVIERGLSLLGSVLSHKLLRWEVHTGHDQHMLGIPYANILEVNGGWSALARTLGSKEKDIPLLKEIIYAQAYFRFDFPNGSTGNLITYNEHTATGQERARLTITLGTPLLPSFVHGLPKRSADRKLVPYPKEQPPLFGRPNEHGQQLTMSLAYMAELRERASELATKGTVQFTIDDWTRMADRSQLPRKLIVPVLETWESGDARSRPFIIKEGTDRYTLSDAHLAERDFLIEAGQMEIGGKKAGLRGVQAKMKKLRVGK